MLAAGGSLVEFIDQTENIYMHERDMGECVSARSPADGVFRCTAWKTRPYTMHLLDIGMNFNPKKSTHPYIMWSYANSIESELIFIIVICLAFRAAQKYPSGGDSNGIVRAKDKESEAAVPTCGARLSPHQHGAHNGRGESLMDGCDGN